MTLTSYAVVAVASLVAFTGSVSSPADIGYGFDGAPLTVVIPAPIADECKCDASLAFEPPLGSIFCPVSTTQVAAQVVWQTLDPSDAPCDVTTQGETTVCEEQAGSKCAADLAPLSVSLFNCWSSGIWVEATGLNNGNRFFYGGSGVTFDPDLEANCKKAGGPTSSEYKIEFYAAKSGGNPLGSFTITLTCSNCALVQ